MPVESIGEKISMPNRLPMMKSSGPCPGAQCTSPLPSSSVTNSSESTTERSATFPTLPWSGCSYLSFSSFLPEISPSTTADLPVSDMTWSRRSFAIIHVSSPTFARTYVYIGCTITAMLATSVQGVVVQMMKYSFGAESDLNFTYIEGSACSPYSSS